MKKQITILKSYLNRSGGIEKNVWQIASAFSKNGFKVKILTTEYENDSSEFEIISFKKPKLGLSFNKILRFDKDCRHYLSKHPSDIVLGMDRNSCQTHIRAGNGVHRAYLGMRKKKSSFLKRASFLCNPLHSTILRIEKKAFESRNLQTLFVNSNMVKNQILNFFSTDPKKIKVVYNGVEWKQFERPFLNTFTKQMQLCDQFKIPNSSLKLFFAGNGYERKGLLNLLKTLSFFKDKDFYLFVAGKDKNITNYQKYAEQLKISDKVFLLGPISDLTSYYQLCDILVLPTIYDPFANVVLEALSMGLFIITTKNNGASEILDTSQGIVLNDPFDVNELKSALSNVIDYKKNMTNAKCIRNSVSEYDYSKQLEKMIHACI